MSVGTSNSFAYGTDNLNRPHEQKHAAVYRAAEAFRPAARKLFGIGDVKTLVLARPGAYSGEQFPGVSDEDQPRDGILIQLKDPRVAEFLAEAGPDDVIIFRYEGGFDDLRLLADNIDHIEKVLGRLQEALDSDQPVSEEIQQELKEFEAKLNDIATKFNQNLQAAGDIIAELSRARVRRGMSPIIFEPVYTWSLFKQPRIPFGLLKRPRNDAPLPRWLKPDLTDYNPNISRYFIEVDAIAEGDNLARWAWVALCQAQTAALKVIKAKYVDSDDAVLEMVPEWLAGINENEFKDIFYAALVNGKPDVKGDGHPGLIEGRPSGIDLIAACILQLWKCTVPQDGRVTAEEYAEFTGQQPKRRAA